jgi:hypothetical protein
MLHAGTVWRDVLGQLYQVLVAQTNHTQKNNSLKAKKRQENLVQVLRRNRKQNVRYQQI